VRGSIDGGKLVSLLDVRSIRAFSGEDGRIDRAQNEFGNRELLQDDAGRCGVGFDQPEANRTYCCPIAAQESHTRFLELLFARPTISLSWVRRWPRGFPNPAPTGHTPNDRTEVMEPMSGFG
jgi:hypothetical protein